MAFYAPEVGGKRNREWLGRYDLREIGARIDKRRRQRKLAVKEICADLGLAKWDWSRKVRRDGSAFTIEECGRIADLLDAPPGWPFLPEEVGEALRPKH